MENKAMIEIFAENLGFARRARGYSQAFMAERLGIARSTYAGYEAGKRSPDVEMIAKLSKSCTFRWMNCLDSGTTMEHPNLIRDAKAGIL